MIGAIGSAVLFDFHLTLTFWLGMGLVILAVFLYGSSARSPHEICDQLASTYTSIVSCAPAQTRSAPLEATDAAEAALIGRGEAPEDAAAEGEAESEKK